MDDNTGCDDYIGIPILSGLLSVLIGILAGNAVVGLVAFVILVILFVLWERIPGPKS